MPLIPGILASGISGNVLPVVTGGTLASDATYYYRVFNANGTLAVSTSALTADIITIACGRC